MPPQALSLDPECESYLLHRALAHMSNADFAKASRDLQARRSADRAQLCNGDAPRSALLRRD
eukprot:5640987-Pleurochrysis_carterae.AAC.1